MKDDMDYESLGSSSRAACACFLDKNENDDPLCCLVHPVPVQHYVHQHLLHLHYHVHPWDTVEPTLAFGP